MSGGAAMPGTANGDAAVGDAAIGRWRWFERWTGGFGGLLLIATWPLWLGSEDFPAVPLLGHVPMLGSPADWPTGLETIALAAMIVGFGAMLAGGGGRWSGRLTLLVPLGLAVAVVLNQHRLQPWAYQFAALAILLRRPQGEAGADAAARGLWAARILALGIYVWSALGKFDYQFAHTVGAEMISALVSPLGVDVARWPVRWVATTALALPLGELLVALLLVVRPTRRLGVCLAVAMHLGLVLILGPWGLGHRPGVLLWNAFFAGQALLLFWPHRKADVVMRAVSPWRLVFPWRLRPLQVALLVVMLGMPVLERAGYFDHWLSWALYAPHSSRATVYVTRPGLDRLPPGLATLAREGAEPGALFVRVPIDRWSLESVRVPIYPQARFQMGVAIALARGGNLDREIRVLVRGPADRWTGRREVETLNGLPDLLRAAEGFWFGVLPRG